MRSFLHTDRNSLSALSQAFRGMNGPGTIPLSREKTIKIKGHEQIIATIKVAEPNPGHDSMLSQSTFPISEPASSGAVDLESIWQKANELFIKEIRVKIVTESASVLLV